MSDAKGAGGYASRIVHRFGLADSPSRRVLPFVGVALLAWLLLLLPYEQNEPPALIASGLLTLALLAALVMVPWSRVPPSTHVVIPFTYAIAIFLLRQGGGGPESGYGSLYLLPVMWLAQFGSRRELIASLVLTGVLLGVPIVFDRADYPVLEMRRAILIEVIAIILGITLQNLVSGLRRARVESDRQRDQLEAVLRAATSTAIIGVDPNGTVTIFNPGAERMLGYRAKDVLGKVTPVIWHDPGEVEARARELGVEPGMDVFTEPVRRGVVEAREWTFIRKDGERRTVSLVVNSRTDRKGRFLGFVGVAVDVTARNLAVENLRRLQERHESILESAGEGIIQIDADEKVVYANRAACDVLGLRPEQLLGERLFDRVTVIGDDGEPRAPADTAIRAAIGRNASRRVSDESFAARGGRSFPVDYVVTPLEDHGSIGAVLIFSDSTKRREAERAKDEFVSVVSHELRTPLTSIRGSLGLLASGVVGELPDRAAAMVDMAVNNTDRLVRLINDILDIERIEAGRATIERKRVDLASLIGQATQEMRPIAAAADVELIADTEPLEIDVDPDRILQTLTNLIGNAVKFSPQGGRVWVDLRRQDEDALVSVRDEGRGIPPDRLERVFNRFEQVDASDARDKGGTGLGLAISRGIVHQHGGRIWAESEPGKGATFRFTLPFDTGDTRAEIILASEDEQVRRRLRELLAAERVPAAADARVEPLRATLEETGAGPDTRTVLIVEDDLDLARLLRTMLERHHVATLHATTPRQAIDVALANPIDVLVLDLMLPGGHGDEVIAELRRARRLRNLPVIVYTARDVEDLDPSRFRLGSTALLTKGKVPPEEIENRVLALLETLSE